MTTSIRYISPIPPKQVDAYGTSPYEHETTALVGQMIILIAPLPLHVSASIIRNPLSTTRPAPPSTVHKQPS